MSRESKQVQRWLKSMSGSWIAAIVALLAIGATGLLGERIPSHELPLALAATAIVHLIVCAVLFEPLARILIAGNVKGVVPFALAISGTIPLLGFIAFFGGNPADAASAEGAIFGAFFVIGGGVFGLIRIRASPTEDAVSSTS